MVSVRDLAEMGRLSPAQVWRALRRLQGARLVELVRKGKGHGKSIWRVRWSFPQVSVSSPYARAKSSTPSVKTKISRRETTRPLKRAIWSDLPIRRPSSALRWAMFRLRREVAGWGLPPPRRENLLRGLGAALWRVLKRGIIRTTAQLRRLVAEVIAALQSAPEGVPATLRRACGYAGAVIASLLRDLQPDPKEALRRRLESLRRLYTAPWLSDSDRAAIAEEGRRLRERLQEYTSVRRGKVTFSTLC